MMRRERRDERLLTHTFAYYFHALSSNCIHPPVSLQRQTQAALCQQARPRYVEEALLFLMRFLQ